MAVCKLPQLPYRHRFSEAKDLKIGLVDLQEHGSLFCYGPFIVSKVCPVGGPYLPKYCTALAHDVWDAEGTANLHKFAPRDHHLLALGKAREHKEYGCCIVIHYQGRLCPCNLTQELFHVHIP